ncbi:hypothetical protein RCL1_003803 [Eukaryota sp. TZLM3-RCL]
MLDGWTNSASHTHYLALFGCFPGHEEATLLSFINFQFDQVIDENQQFDEKQVCFGSENHLEILQIISAAYNRETSDILFIVGDNCETNKHLADLLNLPLVGCYSHRLALEIKTLIDEKLVEVIKVNDLFVKLSTLKNSLVLRSLTNLKPLKRNKTRWSSTFRMIERYERFVQLKVFDNLGRDVKRLLPTSDVFDDLVELLENLRRADMFTKAFQSKKVNLKQGKQMFKLFQEEFPNLTTYASPDSEIVHSPDFESAVVKIMDGLELYLTAHEGKAVSSLKTPEHITGNKRLSGSLEEKLSEIGSDSQSYSTNKYYNLNFIPCTSNEVERLFSRAKILIGSLRHRMLPSSLEHQIFLLTNRSLWNVHTLEKILTDDHNPSVSVSDEDEDALL